MRNHEIAVWSGVSTFFGSLLGIGILDVFNPSDRIRLIGAVILALITGLSVYSKQRYDEAKKKREDIESST